MGVSDNLRGSILMAMAMCAFTFNDACMKVVIKDLPLYQTIVLRGLFTLAALALIAPRLGGLRFRVGGRDVKILLLRTLGDVLATATFLTALIYMPLANVSAIMQALPLAVTLAAAAFLGAPIGWRRLAAILVGFAGVLLIVRPGMSGFDAPALLALASVACVVVRDLASRRLSPHVTSVTAAFFSATGVTGAAALVVPFTGWEQVSPHNWLLVAVASVFLIVGYISVVMAMRVGEIAIVAPFRYTTLVAALILGLVVFGEFPDGLTLFGAGIVVATGIYTLHRERKLGLTQQLAASAHTSQRALGR